MVRSPRHSDWALLERPKPGCRLARVADGRGGTREFVGPPPGQARHARQVTQQVQRGPLRRERGAGSGRSPARRRCPLRPVRRRRRATRRGSLRLHTRSRSRRRRPATPPRPRPRGRRTWRRCAARRGSSRSTSRRSRPSGPRSRPCEPMRRPSRGRARLRSTGRASVSVNGWNTNIAKAYAPAITVRDARRRHRRRRARLRGAGPMPDRCRDGRRGGDSHGSPCVQGRPTRPRGDRQQIGRLPGIPIRRRVCAHRPTERAERTGGHRGPDALRITPTWRDIAARTSRRRTGSNSTTSRCRRTRFDPCASGNSHARSRPTRVPATIDSVRLFDASRFAP